MPYMEWKLLFHVFGLKLFRCCECGSIYFRNNHKTIRIWGESCLKHSYQRTDLLEQRKHC
jgi:hypothetical protein